MTQTRSEALATRVLSFHAGYRCRHSGACCTAGWPIPIEVDQLTRLRAAVATQALRPARGPKSTTSPFLVPAGAPPETPAVVGADRHGCVFRDLEQRRCRIHHALGADALPLACRQFPRVAVTDPRGVSIAFSTFCPTARAMLTSSTPVRIELNAPGCPTGAVYSGLDATRGLPPAIRPDMLMDWMSWWRWEARCVQRLADDAGPIEDTLARLAWVIDELRSWSPGDERLDDRIDRAFREAVGARVAARHWTGTALEQALDEIDGSIPEEWRPDRPVIRGVRPDEPVLRRFAASHAFANWTAHLGRGLRTWLRSIEVPVALATAGLDPGTVDLLLRHLAEPAALARAWHRAEEMPR
jgi:Fe-S-cluster containining protein